MPLDLPTLHSIRRMLRSGIRHAEIARRLDLAVGTISRIASVRRLRRLKLHLLAPDELPEDDPPPDYLAANLRRCPGCGGLVYQWPCLACRLIGERESGGGGRTEWERTRFGEWQTERQSDGGMERPEYGRICCAGESSADCCAPKGQPEKAQGAALGSRSAHQHSAPTGRAESATPERRQRAPLGFPTSRPEGPKGSSPDRKVGDFARNNLLRPGGAGTVGSTCVGPSDLTNILLAPSPT